ncbi:MAG: hypothetical protein ACREFC_11190 [Stellaceae bacterium]
MRTRIAFALGAPSGSGRKAYPDRPISQTVEDNILVECHELGTNQAERNQLIATALWINTALSVIARSNYKFRGGI